MSRRAAGIAFAGLIAIAGTAGCSARQIDAEVTDSVKIEGTSWWRICDGRNAIFWVEGVTDSDPDEIEMVIYDHWACVPEGEAGSENNGPAADPDGIVGDEEN